MTQHTSGPWELVAATDHHGPYIVSEWGTTICDLYAMSDPSSLSIRNGGGSKPIKFADADVNADFIVKAVNAHDALVAALWRMVRQNKPFTMKPIGAPGSIVRAKHDEQIAAYEQAKRALSDAGESP